MYQKQHMNTTLIETSLIIYISFCKLQQQCAPTYSTIPCKCKHTLVQKSMFPLPLPFYTWTVIANPS